MANIGQGELLLFMTISGVKPSNKANFIFWVFPKVYVFGHITVLIKVNLKRKNDFPPEALAIEWKFMIKDKTTQNSVFQWSGPLKKRTKWLPSCFWTIGKQNSKRSVFLCCSIFKPPLYLQDKQVRLRSKHAAKKNLNDKTLSLKTFGVPSQIL